MHLGCFQKSQGKLICLQDSVSYGSTQALFLSSNLQMAHGVKNSCTELKLSQFTSQVAGPVSSRRVPQTTRRGRGYNYCPCFPDEETGAGRLGSMARVTQGQWPRWALQPLVEASAARVGEQGGAGKEGSWRPLHVPATPRRPAGSGNRGCHVHPTREEAAARTRHLPRLLSRS